LRLATLDEDDSRISARFMRPPRRFKQFFAKRPDPQNRSLLSFGVRFNGHSTIEEETMLLNEKRTTIHNLAHLNGSQEFGLALNDARLRCRSPDREMLFLVDHTRDGAIRYTVMNWGGTAELLNLSFEKRYRQKGTRLIGRSMIGPEL
jgi:hypothetical protein